MRLEKAVPLGLLALVASAALLADDLQGADRFLCSSSIVTACWPDGECESAPPSEMDVPQFIEVDLAKERLATTAASGENRTTPIEHAQREDGRIFLQGVENNRAFSFLIDEETGLATVAVARDGLTVTVFGACTPTPSR